MPYSKVSELPPAVKKLPAHKQKIFMAAFNNAMKEYKGDEKRSFATAWSAVGGSAKEESVDRELICEIDLQEAFGVNTDVDEGNGVIKGVTILTGNKVSLNKTLYSDSALAEGKTRYEGAKMFLDHPAKGESSRSIHDFGGVYKDLRIEGNRLKGDLHLVESKRQMVVGIAKMRPAGVGLSIKDRGYGVEKDGVFHVEGFTEGASYSVDFVSEASVNKDLFESRNENENKEDQMDWKIITVDALKKERPDLIESVTNEATAGLVKELNEAKAAHKDTAPIIAKSEKVIALFEAEFDAEVRETVRKMIEPESVSLDHAKAIILGQKTLLESIIKKAANGTPAIKGMGSRKPDEKEIKEGAVADREVSEEIVADAFKS